MNQKTDVGDPSGDKPEDVSPGKGDSSDDFPVVGIGASAGGLAAFEGFFSGMPPTVDPGMAFVLVQHLAPDHKSLLSELIQRYTPMQVFEVEDGMPVQKNCTYIIPPNHDMTLLNGTLQLSDPAARHGQRLPIDHFFRSLALDQRDRAIGIVLSGTGSDGTLGVRAIKGEGGMVLVQSPSSSEFDGMPRSAIATGLVDLELTPTEMPAQLIAYTGQAFGKRTQGVIEEKAEGKSLQRIFSALRTQTGHDFSQYKPPTIQRRIELRMAVRQIETVQGYARFVEQSPEEVEALFRDLLIGVTRFFRDGDAFEALEQQIIPSLLAEKGADDVVRIWVPGCSTGEEAYSLAILFAERLEAQKQNTRIQIFATDIDTQALLVARAGVYPASIASDLTPERLQRFFTTEPSGGGYCVNKALRSMLIFSEHNVIRDPPFSRIDMISCRNLLIYMNSELQKKLMPLFHYSLNRNGFLFLGTSEGVNEFDNLFEALDFKQKLFKRTEDPRHVRNASDLMPPMNALAAKPQHAPVSPTSKVKPTLKDLTEQTLLDQLVHAGALVNADGDLFYLHGRTGMYLEPAPGETGANNVLRMAREGLRSALTIALHNCARTGQIVNSPGLRVKTNGEFSKVNLIVRPVSMDDSSVKRQSLFLVILELVTEPAEREQLEGPQLEQTTDKASEAQIKDLVHELQAKENYLRTVREQLETQNEDMQSVNEELQSTNEELETSKEELQSVNEELSTVNAELQSKVTDLSQANNDMNNLLAGTGIATVFVDHDLRILRFTPAATQIINLIPSDVGRSIGHIVSNLCDYNTLTDDTRKVLDTLVPKAIDVENANGQWYRMRIQPYRTIENVIEGAVISFVDITESKQAHEVLRVNEERLRIALSTLPIFLSNQDKELRYTWIHDASPEIDSQRKLGKTDSDLLPPGQAEKLMKLKQQVLDSGDSVRKKILITVDGKNSLLDLTIEPLCDPKGAVVGITSAYLDVTDLRDSIGKEGEIEAGDS